MHDVVRLSPRRDPARQCWGKVSLYSETVARNWRTLLSWVDPEQGELEIYECPWCGPSSYHLGHGKETGEPRQGLAG